MCLFIKDYFKGIKPSIATEDIYVQKSLDFDSVEVDGCVKLKPKANYRPNYYYSKVETAWFRKKGMRIYSGIHAFIGTHYDRDYSVWVIPKGSKYYLGTGNEIVSNKLVFQKYFDLSGKESTNELVWEKESFKRKVKKFFDYLINYF